MFWTRSKFFTYNTFNLQITFPCPPQAAAVPIYIYTVDIIATVSEECLRHSTDGRGCYQRKWRAGAPSGQPNESTHARTRAYLSSGPRSNPLFFSCDAGPFLQSFDPFRHCCDTCYIRTSLTVHHTWNTTHDRTCSLPPPPAAAENNIM